MSLVILVTVVMMGLKVQILSNNNNWGKHE